MTPAPSKAANRPTPATRSRDFWGSATRLVKRLAPQRRPCIAVIMLGVSGTAIGVIVPRILGHATDLLFNGVIGRQLPAGLTKAQAVAAARSRGANTFADLLSGMNVVPGHGVDFGAVAKTLTLALALYLVSALLIWAQARLLNVTVQRTMVALRSDVEDKIHRLPLSYFDGRQRGELLSRVTNDVDNIQSSLSMTISQLLTAVLTVVAVLAMMLSISPLLVVITVLTVPLSLLATRAIARRSRRLFVAQWTSIGRLNAHIEETYSGFTVVKTFGHQAASRGRFRTLNDEVYQASFGAQFFSGLVAPATTFIGNLGYVAVAVVGGLQVATGRITLGNIQAFIQYVRQFNSPLSQLAGMYNTVQSGLASAERVFTLLDEPEESPDHAPAQPGPAVATPQPGGRVEFAHVSFAYHPGTPVIEDLSMVAEPGSTVAIVGPTGAGKTTLVNLLMRFYDVDAGRILLDGIDITTMDRQSLRSRIGMVLQDTWLFEGTIAENIAYGRPDAGEDEVLEAARAAHVDPFVRTLPAGYQTRISGDGGNISAGEKQLITIARAFLARPQLLILDEATSSVDTRTEALIQHAMCELRRDRTSFIIAHRLSTIRDAERILVVEAGRIVEQGNHAELLARRGAYYAMTQA
ncbi:putative ABC transporter ATP-binding protein [Mycobacterium mantenii]|uniref:Fatty acid ABC transporter ATP-binding/permease protein n=1 Tax=Mycobacterium mantenii TaxID=560555 RepID=A0A1X0F9R9_MYCNT|nr:ABC transporter ATP-binding protein [Mycobacterium mantenii]MCV7241209.1 ABC transporter ATP-binding protein [Mycobacterium mantenii]ORA98394.1 ABC transporter ATP-binding protein [Mycobacterium mantenii]BBY38512.1 putative ABC transporter ATP-binding protein [Mycobacterium mantenii]